MADDSPPDVTDLKTYDVPDPIPARGSCLRALVIMAVGVGAALGFLQAVRAEHYFAVMANPAEYGWQRSRALRYAKRLPEAELRERVLGLEDPATRGAFHEVLADTGDASHAGAIVAYLREVGEFNRYGEERAAEEALDSLAKLGDGGVPELFELSRQLAEQGGYSDKRIRAVVLASLEQDYSPETLAPHAVKIEDLAERGRWHRALATTKDPEQIEAIVKYVEAQSASGSKRFEAEAKSLLAFGRAGTDQLKSALHQESRPVVNLAAEALRDVNLEFLTTYCREQLTAYEQGVFAEDGLRWAARVQMAVEEAQAKGKLEELLAQVDDPAVIQEARAVIERFSQHAFRIMEMLKAMSSVREDERVDFCFVHGLSAFDREVAEYCAKALQQRLQPAELIDVMFRFIAKKDQFMIKEVEIYEGMLRATGPAGSLRIAQNLERLLDEAGGDPSGVFWIYKKMGFKVLRATGTPKALPVLERYAADPESYSETSSGPGGHQEREIFFKDEVAAAVEAIQQRAGR